MLRGSLFLVLLAVGPTDRVRDGNAAARAGSPDAERFYAEAAERTSDPGLVAFNRAALQFGRGEFREAELNYLRCLDDRAIPATRRRQALYNRGVCLLRRDGDARVLRAAIGCFEDCLAEPGSDKALVESARFNLELAKVLWDRARSRQPEPPTPNESNPDQPRPSPMREPMSEGPGETTPRPNGAADQTETATDANTKQAPMGSDTAPAGAGPLPVVKDEEPFQRLTPRDTEALLERAAARLKAAHRKNELLRAGPERTHVRDW